jgi:hypothetical protein
VVQNSRVAAEQSTAAAAQNNSGLALRMGVQSAVVMTMYCHRMAPNKVAVTNLNSH